VSYTDADIVRTRTAGRGPFVRVVELSVRGGGAVFVIRGRGHRSLDADLERCSESIVPVQRLPGYSAPGPHPIYRIRIPTCAASRAGTVAIAPGPFIAGGAGEPRVSFASELPPEQPIELAGYAIDRTEVTNAAFQVFASMMNLHGIPMPDYPRTTELLHAGDADHPVSFVNWPEARAYCRYLGKDLPTLDQWDRALRGGIEVAGVRNEAPRRTFAWAGDFVSAAAALPDVPARHRPFPVGSFPRDISPDGVADLSGNVQEWVLASPPAGEASAVLPATEQARAGAWAPGGRFRITRGCNWDDAGCAGGQSAIDFTALPNQRAFDLRNFTIGFRCRAAFHPMLR
jgi:formylglycine-generating enzyme required for sulfatase activity